MSAPSQPYVGQVVWFYPKTGLPKKNGTAPLAAIVTSVIDSTHLSLFVLPFNSAQGVFKPKVAYGSDPGGSTQYCSATGAD